METSASTRTSNAPQYWVIKGKPSENDFDLWLKERAHDRWRTAKPPKGWAQGDRLFFWRANPLLDIIGLGEFLDSRKRRDDAGQTWFYVQYLTPCLSVPVGIEELRRDAVIGTASFLKAGPAGTVFPLSCEQGERLYRLVCRRNPFVIDVWPDLNESGQKIDIPELDTLGLSGAEGKRSLASHLRIERNRRLIEAKKRAVRQATGKLACEVCQFDFLEFYGSRGKDYCEVHHRKLLSSGAGERVTRLSDLSVVCSNCHRMLHHGHKLASIKSLRRMIRRNSHAGPIEPGR